MRLVLDLPDVTHHEGTTVEFKADTMLVILPTRDFKDREEQDRWEKVTGQALCTIRDGMGWGS
jgi:hypothetical protein